MNSVFHRFFWLFQVFLEDFYIGLSSCGRIRLPSSHPFVFVIGRDPFLGFLFYLPQKAFLAEVSDGGDTELVIIVLESGLEDPLRLFCLTASV